MDSVRVKYRNEMAALALYDALCTQLTEHEATVVHARPGVAMARICARRLGFGWPDVEAIAWMVREFDSPAPIYDLQSTVLLAEAAIKVAEDWPPSPDESDGGPSTRFPATPLDEAEQPS